MTRSTSAALAMSLLLGACASDDATRIDATKGRQVYLAQCAACHSADAEGGGPASMGLGVAPPDLTQLAALNGGTFPRNDVLTVIDGYTRRDHYNDPMPLFGAEDLGAFVQVEENGVSTPIPAHLLAVVTYLERIQR